MTDYQILKKVLRCSPITINNQAFEKIKNDTIRKQKLQKINETNL